MFQESNASNQEGARLSILNVESKKREHEEKRIKTEKMGCDRPRHG